MEGEIGFSKTLPRLDVSISLSQHLLDHAERAALNRRHNHNPDLNRLKICSTTLREPQTAIRAQLSPNAAIAVQSTMYLLLMPHGGRSGILAIRL